MWWREAVVLQIYPRSFADASGDGVGDLEGVRSKLDHLQWMGVDALWLSPIFRSPMADFGYDVADYRDIDPLFGDLGAFDRLLADAHTRGIRVLLDWVPNHTSDQHPWFLEARASRDSPKRDWYRWRDGTDGGVTPPNNWKAAFADEPAWTWDEATQQFYLHTFLPQQPDLNWDNPEVVEAMHDVLRFWMERGVDGFRADVVHLIGKDPALPDDASGDLVAHHDHDGTHALLRGIRGVIEEHPDRMIVGEVNLTRTDLIVKYLGDGDELHIAFDFASLHLPWEAGAWRERIAHVEEVMGERWPTWVFSNHDQPRVRTRLEGDEDRARAAAVLLLTLRGTPFMYAGEELGLEDAVVPPDRVVDPGGRDGCRAPIPWTANHGHGWPAEPWLPWPPEAAARSAETLRAEPGSILHLYRELLAARRASDALRRGTLRLLPDADDGVLGFERESGGDVRRVLVGFAGGAPEAPEGWEIEVAGGPAVVLRPAP
ncbi:MAG: alpha-amylase family glycosyl hydrolase [Solirubrobacteraceae bacterium]